MAVCASCGTENPEEARFCMACAASLAPAEAAEPFRKTVTILFSDVVGSTALGERLDPETVSLLMNEYFEAMKPILERHGGTVAKFIGDAVMAVFGIPVLHEDDALRAVRAGLAMREGLAEFNVECERRFGVTIATRTALNTGAVAGAGLVPDRNFVAGDAANVAARLQQSAAGGEILLGPATYRIVRDSVDAEPVGPLELKGKDAALEAYRVLALLPGAEAVPRRRSAPMLGRERERRRLADAWEQVVSRRVCHLFTVLGAAGIGKSRLADEFLASVDGATVGRGRCLSYGEGITFWPLVEILTQLLGTEPRARLDALGLDPLAARRVAGLLGEGDEASSVEELFWGVRKLLEAEASLGPLVVVLDDLHWAEPTLLDLVEHVADWSREAPILLLCLARPELLERRSGWAGGKLNASSLLLEPLEPEEGERLLSALRAAPEQSLRARILASAEGNPLFLEEMAAMLEDGSGGAAVPPTIQALLAARLDQLPREERVLLERAAVEGQVFHRGALRALLPDEPELEGRLQNLVRKDLLRSQPAQFPGEDGFRFRHVLIREAAYQGLAKQRRADLHERFADWLVERSEVIVEADELLGYHYEQAHRYRVELGLPGENGRLAGIAAARLASAGLRASSRGDIPGASNLLERACALLPDDDPARPRLLVELGVSLFARGDLAEAEARFRTAAGAAERSGDRLARARAGVQLLSVATHSGELPSSEALPLVEAELSTLEELGDDRALAEAWHFLGLLRGWTGRVSDGAVALERAISHAQGADDERLATEAAQWLALLLAHGATPVAEVERRLAVLRRQLGDNALSQAWLSWVEAMVAAMRGNVEQARSLLDTGRALTRDFGVRLFSSAAESQNTYWVEWYAGTPEAAEERVREGCRALEEMGETGMLSTGIALLADIEYRRGRLAQAERLARRSDELATLDDAESQALWRTVAAKVGAREGAHGAAELLAREAVSLVEPTDFLVLHAWTRVGLAEVLELAGRAEEAAVAFEEAAALYDQKGARPTAARIRAGIGA